MAAVWLALKYENVTPRDCTFPLRLNGLRQHWPGDRAGQIMPFWGFEVSKKVTSSEIVETRSSAE